MNPDDVLRELYFFFLQNFKIGEKNKQKYYFLTNRSLFQFFF